MCIRAQRVIGKQEIITKDFTMDKMRDTGKKIDFSIKRLDNMRRE